MAPIAPREAVESENDFNALCATIPPTGGRGHQSGTAVDSVIE
jgi:hypothetical protein